MTQRWHGVVCTIRMTVPYFSRPLIKSLIALFYIITKTNFEYKSIPLLNVKSKKSSSL